MFKKRNNCSWQNHPSSYPFEKYGTELCQKNDKYKQDDPLPLDFPNTTHNPSSYRREGFPFLRGFHRLVIYEGTIAKQKFKPQSAPNQPISFLASSQSRIQIAFEKFLFYFIYKYKKFTEIFSDLSRFQIQKSFPSLN